MKLTPAQLELLLGCPTTAVRAYKPAQRLVALGLAEWVNQQSDYFIATEKG